MYRALDVNMLWVYCADLGRTLEPLLLVGFCRSQSKK